MDAEHIRYYLVLAQFYSFWHLCVAGMVYAWQYGPREPNVTVLDLAQRHGHGAVV